MKDSKNVLLLSVGLAIKLLVGLAAVRLSAQYLGPEGFGMTGQLSSLTSVVALLAGAGVSAGLAKVYAENESRRDLIPAWIGVANSFSLGSAILVSAVMLIFSGLLAEHLFLNISQSHWVVIALAVSALPIAFSNVGQGKVNGSRRSDLYTLSMMIGSVLGILGLWLCGSLLGGLGALLGMIWLPVAQSVVMIFFGWVADQAGGSASKNRDDLLKKVKFFLSYGTLAMVTGLVMPLVYIAIRLWVQNYGGNEEFGFWQAALRISEAYCQLPMLLLTVVMFSRFASSASGESGFRLLQQSYLSMGVTVVAVVMLVYITRFIWVDMVFTAKFRPMEKYLPWQLTGDAVRLLSYVGTTFLSARGRLRVCIGAELVQGGGLLAMNGLLVPRYGVLGASYAYVATYTVYLFYTAYLVFGFSGVYGDWIRSKNEKKDRT